MSHMSDFITDTQKEKLLQAGIAAEALENERFIRLLTVLAQVEHLTPQNIKAAIEKEAPDLASNMGLPGYFFLLAEVARVGGLALFDSNFPEKGSFKMGIVSRIKKEIREILSPEQEE
jgi:hypothetical protein